MGCRSAAEGKGGQINSLGSSLAFISWGGGGGVSAKGFLTSLRGRFDAEDVGSNSSGGHPVIFPGFRSREGIREWRVGKKENRVVHRRPRGLEGQRSPSTHRDHVPLCQHNESAISNLEKYFCVEGKGRDAGGRLKGVPGADGESEGSAAARWKERGRGGRDGTAGGGGKGVGRCLKGEENVPRRGVDGEVGHLGGSDEAARPARRDRGAGVPLFDGSLK